MSGEQVSRSRETVSREQVSREQVSRSKCAGAGKQEQVTWAAENMYAKVWCKTTFMMDTSTLVLGS